MSRGAYTGRVRNYDDITDNMVSRRGGPSSKLLFVTILLALVICVLAVLVWVSILKSKDLAKGASGSGLAAPIIGVIGDSSGSVQTPPVSNASSSDASSMRSVEGDGAASTELDHSALGSSAGMASTSGDPSASVVYGPTSGAADVSLDIDNALRLVSSSSGPDSSGSEQPSRATDYISAKDYALDGGDSSNDVVTRGVEIKKPAIAQNLSISQQSSLSRDIVKYTEYSIQEGDSLDSIAQKFNLTRETIISVNQIKNTSSLFSGSTLQIPDRNGTMYTVKEGDTLSSIVQQLNLALSWKSLSDVNGLRNENVSPGDRLFIPLESVQETGTLSVALEPSFALPCDDAVTVALYNQKVADPLGSSAVKLDGILLQAPEGSPVCASESGTVIDRGFNDNGTGFVKILHPNGYTTYYDYVADICVNSTDRVSKGDVIGFFAQGSTNLLYPTVFFRIEQDGIPLDPYSFL